MLLARSLLRSCCCPIHPTSTTLLCSRSIAARSASTPAALTMQLRRQDSPWVCPACSNPSSTPGKLLHHMSKCCNDLLVYISSHHNQQLGGHQSLQDHFSSGTPAAQPLQQELECGQGAQPSSSSSSNSSSGSLPEQLSDELLQQLLASAAEQERALRRQVLRLQFVANDAAAVTRRSYSDDADGDSDDSRVVDISTTQHVDSSSASATNTPRWQLQQGAQEEAAATPAAPDPAALSITAHSSSPAAPRRSRRRRGNSLPVLQTPDQIAELLKLPHKRVMRLIERAPRSIQLVADPEPVAVVYEDQHFLAVCKPPGLRSAPIHRFMGGSAFNRMIGHLGYEPHLLHRLDMNTSGVLVAAKDKATASAAHAQFRNKTVRKAYLCLAAGVPQQQQFDARGPIGDHPLIKVARSVVEGGLPALTHMQVLSAAESPISCRAAAAEAAETEAAAGWGPAAPDISSISEGCCLVCCQPVTGRTHQIRVHMAAAGHPLLGDELYGLQGPWIARQALHAFALTLQHPATGQPITFVAPPPQDFVSAAAALTLEVPDSSHLLKLVQN